MCFVFDVNEDVDDAFVLDDDDDVDVDVGFVGATNIEAILINLFCYKPKSNRYLKMYRFFIYSVIITFLFSKLTFFCVIFFSFKIKIIYI